MEKLSLFTKKKNQKPYIKNIVYNKKVKYNYFIDKTIEAGLVLKGWEIKSIRSYKINIENSYISIKNREVYLVGANIFPLNLSSIHDCLDHRRMRKLLLKNYEINYLIKKNKIKGCTIVVMSVYLKNSWCKIKIAFAKGKKKFDKRFDIKNREWNIKKSKILKKKIIDSFK